MKLAGCEDAIFRQVICLLNLRGPRCYLFQDIHSYQEELHANEHHRINVSLYHPFVYKSSEDLEVYYPHISILDEDMGL